MPNVTQASLFFNIFEEFCLKKKFSFEISNVVQHLANEGIEHSLD
jgi:hypothetical protein